MLDKIMEIVGGDALNAITGKAGISMDQAKEMLPLAQDSLQEGLMSQLTSGNTEGLLGMFNSVAGGGLANNGIFGSIKGMFMQKIMTSMGLPESIAGLAAGSGLSSIVGGLSSMLQADGDNDDIDASNILNVLGGGDAGGMLGGLLGAVTGGTDGIGDILGKVAGGAADGAGGIADVAGDLLGGGGDAAKKAGGLLGSIGKLFGK